MTKLLLAAIVILLAVIAFRPYVDPPQAVLAQARFDHVSILANNWIRNGRQGILLLDRRNGNVWFMGTQSEKGPGLVDPVYLGRVPFEKLDEIPPGR